jgi:precorrin-6A/cobalt-precorrin-6A reductase
MTRVLLLGGTTEASALAQALADEGIAAVFSYAGRTARPLPQPIAQRTGGFGGADGLADYLRAEGFTHIVDATHPFATMISRNAVAAARSTGLPLIAVERAPWTPGPGDHWLRVPDVETAVAALPATPARVFLAIGKQSLTPFAARPEHHYLLRLVDPPTAALPLASADVVIARGPFEAEGDRALMAAHGITHIVAKNSGGSGAEAKLIAARALGLPVILIDRPTMPGRAVVAGVAELLAWLGHRAPPADRGV